MLGSSIFNNDPFFAGHQDHMRQMGMFFGDSFGGGMLALPGVTNMDRQRQQQQAQNMQVSERNMSMDPFSNFNSMFSNMRSMMSDMHGAFDQPLQITQNPNGQMFQQSSFMSYSNSGNGAPRVYQASSSTRQGPGGIRETRNTVRDSDTGVEKMAVGRHITDRGHVVERSRNARTGEAAQNQEFINIDEEDAGRFDEECQEKWHSAMRGVGDRRRIERSRHAPLADARRSRHPALPEPEPHRARRTSHRRE